MPQQPNFCDCGVYLLHFAERFLCDPEPVLHGAVHRILRKKGEVLDWADADLAGRRQSMKEDILRLSDQWKVIKAETDKREAEEKAERKRRKAETAKAEGAKAKAEAEAVPSTSPVEVGPARTIAESVTPTQAPAGHCRFSFMTLAGRLLNIPAREPYGMSAEASADQAVDTPLPSPISKRRKLNGGTTDSTIAKL